MKKLILSRYLWHYDTPTDGDGPGSGSGTASQEGQSADSANTDEVSIAALQGIEELDENALMGIDDGTGDDDNSSEDDESSSEETADSGSKDEEDDTKDTDDGKADDSDKTGDNEDKTDDDKTDGDDDKKADEDQKPPKGFVKLVALQEARDENKFLKGEIAKLKVQAFEAAQAKKPETQPLVSENEVKEFENFKQLTEEEFEDKFEDDQSGGLKYLQKLSKFQDFQRRQTDQQLQEANSQRELEAIALELQNVYDTTAEQMETILPGIFDDSAVQTELSDFAADIGFTDDMFYLTNPETRIILPGETEPLVLGEQAADILKVLTTARSKIGEKQQVDTKSMREEIKTEVEKELRPAIEKELLAKFKKDTGNDFTSIDDIPTSETDNKFLGKVLTDAEFNKLSDAEQEAYLSGP